MERLVRVGVALVVAGCVASALTLLPLLTDGDPAPTPIYLLCFAAPLGLGLILVALWRRAAGRSGRIHRT